MKRTEERIYQATRIVLSVAEVIADYVFCEESLSIEEMIDAVGMLDLAVDAITQANQR